jgi:hypothetical protein
MFNPLDDFQHFAAGGHRRPPPPVVVVPITLTTHALNTCKPACGMHMWGGGGMRAARLLVAYVRQASPPKELLGHLARRQEETCTCLRKHKGLS